MYSFINSLYVYVHVSHKCRCMLVHVKEQRAGIDQKGEWATRDLQVSQEHEGRKDGKVRTAGWEGQDGDPNLAPMSPPLAS